MTRAGGGEPRPTNPGDGRNIDLETGSLEGEASEQVVPKQATLARPGAAATLADAIRRGEQCTGDFTTADHLAMVERDLADVREQFGVPPLG